MGIDIVSDGNDPVAVMMMAHNYLNYGERNAESLAELFVALLVKHFLPLLQLASVEKLWQKGLCVSLRDGFWISKAWDSEISTMSVEDFTDGSQNVARAVGSQGFEKIHSCIHRSLRYLEAFSEGQMQGTKLKQLLFGTDSVALNLDRSTAKLSVPNNSKQMKKMQSTKDLKGVENQSTTHLAVANESHQTKKRHSTGMDESKGVKRWKGAQLLDRRGGVQLTELGKGQVVQNLVTPLPTLGWEGKHPVSSQIEWQNFGENRCHLTTHFVLQVPYIVPLSHSLDSSTCHGPVVLPSISASNFTSFQGLCNATLPPPLLSLLNPLGLNISYIQNQNPSASMLHSESIQGQHEHQPHPNTKDTKEIGSAHHTRNPVSLPSFA
ncbi:hypothetical protein PTKIN_Ptkin07bG0101800 [Pterospermum kingtungense]